MPRALIHYFSGTGNTHRAMGIIKAELESAGYDVTLRSIEDPGKSLEADLHVFGFPVYACAVPPVMRRYLDSLPNGQQMKAAVVGIFGEVNLRRTLPGYEGKALVEAQRLLDTKGYEVFFTDAIGYPFSATMICNSPTGDDLEGLRERGDARIREMAAKIKEGTPSLKPCHPLNQGWCWVFGKMFGLIGRRIMGKLYVANSRCSLCGQCIAICPVGAIKMKKGKPHWTFSCEACQRCINNCPSKAIQTSFWRLAVAAGLCVVPIGSLIAPHSPLFIKPVVDLAACAAALLLADLLISRLERLPGIGRIFEFSFTRRFRRYQEPSFKPGIAQQVPFRIKG